MTKFMTGDEIFYLVLHERLGASWANHLVDANVKATIQRSQETRYVGLPMLPLKQSTTIFVVRE